MHSHMHMCELTCRYARCIYARRIYASIYACVRAYMHVRLHICIYAVYIYMHVYIYVHTFVRISNGKGVRACLSASNPSLIQCIPEKDLAPNPPTRGTKSTKMSGRAISRPQLTHQWYEDHSNEQEDHFRTRKLRQSSQKARKPCHGERD